ncbi:hypothetical protein NQ315_003850, partial [Exocentrus adspersus]
LLPKVVHFRVAKYLSFLVGLWPVVSSENKKTSYMYNILSKFLYVYFCLFILTEIIQLVILLTEEDIKYEEVTNNLSISLVYINSAVRCKVCKGRVIKRAITEVTKFEKELWQGMDADLIKIYEDNAKMNSLFCALFASSAIFTSAVYTVWPFFAETPSMMVDNVTVEVKTLPVSAWVPFNPQKHYVTAYVLLLFNANYLGTMFLISTEILAFGLMSYPIGQIHILKHVIRNFAHYKKIVQRRLNLTPEAASKVQLKECIIKHQDIIRYIGDFNEEMKHTYLLDFLQCSLQLTCILYRFLSEAISLELYNMDWLEETIQVKKMMLFMMMRVHRPLKLFIGVFKTMSLETFISVSLKIFLYKPQACAEGRSRKKKPQTTPKDSLNYLPLIIIHNSDDWSNVAALLKKLGANYNKEGEIIGDWIIVTPNTIDDYRLITTQKAKCQ